MRIRSGKNPKICHLVDLTIQAVKLQQQYGQQLQKFSQNKRKSLTNERLSTSSQKIYKDINLSRSTKIGLNAAFCLIRFQLPNTKHFRHQHDTKHI